MIDLLLRIAVSWAVVAAGGKQIAQVASGDDVIHEAFAFSDNGAQLAHVRTNTNGKTMLHVGPPGGKTWTIDITTFTRDPEKILFLGGLWIVVANEGARRAIVLGSNGRTAAEIGPFGDCFISTSRGKTFVTVTDKGETSSGHAYNIAAYRPNGVLTGSKLVTIGADGTLAGSQGLVFVAFSGGYLQALVKKAGRYDAKADVRGGSQVATLDVLSGKTGPGKNLNNAEVLRLADKRGEKPGLDAFVRVNDDTTGFELVGPGEKVRSLALPTKFSLYETASLQQKPSGGQLFFSLTVDPLNPDQVAAQKKGTRLLHVFEVSLGSAKATQIGELPLEEAQSYTWAAGGNKLAVLKQARANGRNEIAIFGVK